MTINVADPLALLAIQAGQAPTPAQQSGSDSSNPLDVPQQAHAIGDPVPIVFGRQRNSAGGVFISPKATECRFSNDANNAVTASYHLVLSEGQIGTLQVRDVFQRQCRVGTAAQTYNQRAGTWTPENAITAQPGYDKPEASYYCGTVGTYTGISTLSFQATYADGLDFWNRQVHVFVRNGMQVKRWLDSQAAASSDSFADLAYWLMQRSARIPEALIDTTSITDTSRFLDANSITTNCWITESINYDELVSSWGRYHLLRPSNRNGKAGLRPLLPVNNDGTIKTTALSIAYTFDDDLVIGGSVDIRYSDWSSRQPFVAQIVWRQQLDGDVGIVRTAEVRYAGTATDGPYESHDLSAFCTREDHAVKVGAFILSRRVRSAHTIRFRARPEAHNTLLEQGSIVRVRLKREARGEAATYHDFIYQVERINKTLAGDVGYECSHHPVDDELRSLIALDVANATGTGVLLTSNLTGTGCDINSSGNTADVATNQSTPADVPESAQQTVLDPGRPLQEDPAELPEPTPNTPDGVDATPIGPMNTCPQPGGVPGIPPDDACAGGTTRLTVGALNADGTKNLNVNPVVQEGYENWLVPIDLPSQLGVSTWSETYVEFNVNCPSGQTQITDPCTDVEADVVNPEDYTYYRWTNGSSTSNWCSTSTPPTVEFPPGLVLSGTATWWAGGSITADCGAVSGVGGRLVRIAVCGITAFTASGSISCTDGVSSVFTVVGRWEFSDDQSTVLQTWLGSGA